MKTLLEILGWILVAVVAMHWFSSGADDIIEGPPEAPEHSLYQTED